MSSHTAHIIAASLILAWVATIIFTFALCVVAGRADEAAAGWDEWDDEVEGHTPNIRQRIEPYVLHHSADGRAVAYGNPAHLPVCPDTFPYDWATDGDEAA